MATKKRKITEDDSRPSKADRHSSVLDKKSKALKLAAENARKRAVDLEEEVEAEPVEIHDLKPLPQPKLVESTPSAPAYDGRPEWLSKPILLDSSVRKPFTELGLDERAALRLKSQGFDEAYAVQAEVIPRLLPTAKRRSGDVLVRAPTGSGKTLSYAVPIVRDVGWGCVTRLRALIVLPTRGLVTQAKEVFERVSQVYEGEGKRKVKIGVALGNQELAAERKTLIRPEKRYDPELYESIKAESDANRDLMDLFPKADPRLGSFEGDIVEFSSNVDVLICTPGRLIEHMEQTPDWLDYVRWLVIDEADKLLGQNYQDWLPNLMEKLNVTKFTRREFPDFDYEGPRKVILSATLTPGLDVLERLKLHRPKLFTTDSFSLPATLEEYAVRIHNINLKPLYLLDLIRNHMKGSADIKQSEPASDAASDTSSDTSSDGSSDSTSDSGSDTSSDDSSDEEDEPKQKKRIAKKSDWKPPICLIFTSSNEAALRLARLLELLDEECAPYIDTITSLKPTYMRRKILKTFTSEKSPIRLLIASDIMARGIDLPKLQHVINYDLPQNVENYVHRVGRTARAERHGQAFTLVGDDNSEGWVWGKVLKSPAVQRARPVGRLQVDRQDEKFEMFEEALTKLGEEAKGK